MLHKPDNRKNRGATSVMAVFFVTLFGILAISFASLSDVNVQMARNHRNVADAQAAAESGLEFARYLITSYVPPVDAYSFTNTITETQAQETFVCFAQHVHDVLLGSALLDNQGIYCDTDTGELRIPANGSLRIGPEQPDGFVLHFQFLPADADESHRLVTTSTGFVEQLSRQVGLTMPIRKDAKILEYAVASRGRVWLTGDTTIDGDVYSDWHNAAKSPFNTTSETIINGTVNTVFTLDEVDFADWQLETLDEFGDPVYDENGDPVVSEDDEIQGDHHGINYDQQSDVPGMDISDYNTDQYNQGLTSLAASATQVVEYFPHASGDYTQPRDGTVYSTWNRRLTRQVYENMHFSNARLPDDFNALFKNCTFDDVLYIDCYKSGSYKYNNVRFDNCTFNGPIITDVPQVFKWQNNCLYFTGAATFQNSAMTEATILAPHFNVNLGNNNPAVGDNNVLTGAIVGGIVDVRGNAQIYGTIVSMCDTSAWTSGYVTNIGATLGDGGSETTELGDIGVIEITPDQDNLLPSGMRTPIIIALDPDSYVEY